MNEIAYPLRRRMRRRQVEDLQVALRALLDAGVIDSKAGRELRAPLDAERDRGVFGPVTERTVTLFQQELGTEVSGEVDEVTARALNALVADLDGGREVSGTVRFESGLPAEGITVEAVDRDLRGEQPLQRGETVADGSYRLAYPDQAAEANELGSADLVIRAFGADGSLLATSPVLFNAPAQAEVDLTIPRERLAPPSLFTRVRKTIKPLLGDVAVEDLDETEEHDDLTFLAGETGFEQRTVARFALAHRLASADGIVPEFWFALLGDTSMPYGEGPSLAEDRTQIWTWLRGLDDLALKRSLERAIASGDIEPALGKSVPKWIKEFARLMAGRLLDDPAAPSFVKPALEHAGIDGANAQERFAQLLRQQGAFTPDLASELEKDPAFGPERVADLSASFELGRLARAAFPFVATLKNEFGINRPEQIPALARVDSGRWSELVARVDPAGLDVPIDLGELPEPLQTLKGAVYATGLQDRLREMFPTEAFAGDLERALNNGGAAGLQHADTLLELIDAHPEFDLLHTRIDSFEGLPADDEFKDELKAVQRVFKLAPTLKATSALRADGLHSAQSIYRLGANRFAKRYAELTGASEEESREVWRRAADTHAAVLSIIGDLVGLDDEMQPLALKRKTAALKTFPNWQSLFREGDLCECDHCRSVLGPGAYFADILLFLQNRAAADHGSAADVLLGRRPDLGWLELGCENANTLLPYIDLVCEVLEAAVAGGEGDRQLTGLTSISAPGEVRAALAAHDLDPGDFQLSQLGADRWVVHGTELTLQLEKKAAPDFYARILPNTKTDAAELRAHPAYVNETAYGRLAAARYPFALPFDLYGEQVRAGLQASDIERWELMETLRGKPPGNPAEADVAAEYLGIGVDERSVICDAKPAEQEAIWGLPVSGLQNVKVFLARTGLEFEQLLALLDLSFVNPGGALSIEDLDATCDTSMKRIDGLDASALDRIHRFLRLWRKLDGWELWELDLALAGKSLDAAFLIDLHKLGRLRARLGDDTTVEELCALLGDLNTATHFTQPHAKRGDGLYQRLFFNPKLTRPLDPAFGPARIPRSGATAETIRGHHEVVQAALGVTEQDLERLMESTQVPDRLTLEHLSLLWRNAWLARKLELSVADWQTVLKLLGRRVQVFARPSTAVRFVGHLDRLMATGFTPDQLNWLLRADRSAAAATSEADTTRFLAGLRADIAATRARFDPAQHDSSDAERLGADLMDLLRQLHRDDVGARFAIDVLRGEVQMSRSPVQLPPGHQFPPRIAISYDRPTSTLSLTGVLTTQQRDDLLADQSLDQAYKDAIADFFARPRLAIAWLDPVFSTPLEALPADLILRAPLSYDAEERTLNVVGVLTEEDERALQGLSQDATFLAALHRLFNQPRATGTSPDRRWLAYDDLATPLADNIVANLRLAVARALAYLAKRSVEDLVVQRAGAQLGLTDGLARRVLTAYRLPAETLLAQLTASAAPGLDGWYWADRVAMLWKQWKLSVQEWRRLHDLTPQGHLLDFGALHPNGAPALTTDHFLATSGLITFKRSVPELHVPFLDLLSRLQAGGYGSVGDFAADVERMDPTWGADDVTALVGTLNLHYPSAYLHAGAWERLRRALAFTRSLQAGAATARTFAAATMSDTHASALEQLLRAALGTQDWLALCTEIQDRLRERKRDALVAYLLAQQAPADVPTGRWEDTSDLYAYYLLDVEMSSCQLTSRLVQGSASVQLFAQRCLMGLEPRVDPQADAENGDSDWGWWSWMSKYRVWQANLEVFLWPENWIEPELNRDRSTFMKELESELLQGTIDAPTVEAAFTNYLAKLDGVAQLEPAGFYQEDDGAAPTVHVFARTKGAEPHLYYYRRFDYRSWTPWEKVDLDISGDYLIPAVIARRLFLFWPVFVDVPADDGPPTMTLPDAGDVTPTAARKVRQVRLAMSELRQGKWTPKVISKDNIPTEPFKGEIAHDGYTFFAVDRDLPGAPFEIVCAGAGDKPDGDTARIPPTAFRLAGCHGVPEKAPPSGSFVSVITPEGAVMRVLDWDEDPAAPTFDALGKLGAWDDFTLHDWFIYAVQPPVSDPTGITLINLLANRMTYLGDTPGTFAVAPPWQMSYFDRLLTGGHPRPVLPSAAGLWLPFFYRDDSSTYFVLPELPGSPPVVQQGFKAAALRFDFEDTSGREHRYYADIMAYTRMQRKALAAGFEAQLTDAYFATANDAQLHDLDVTLAQETEAMQPGWAPPFSNDQRRVLMTARWMHGTDGQLGTHSMRWFQERRLEFRGFYHPFACAFAKLVEDPLQGIPALMRRETQLQDTGFSFRLQYEPTTAVADPWTEDLYPHEDVDFKPDGAYSSYNWELFFHAPLFIANTLSRNQRFEEARQWYQFIFNPLGAGTPAPNAPNASRFWITKPFYETTADEYVGQRIDTLLRMLAGDTTAPGFSLAMVDALLKQVSDWRTHPFEPHRIAAYRTVAYQKAVFMKYLDNLIAWADQLFGQDSLESINEATQLYILAAELLGPRPKRIPARERPAQLTFNELGLGGDGFADVMVSAENLIPVVSGNGTSRADAPPLPTLMFCIPPNEKLLGYWDTVADRLYKIRHCMNIEGVVRQLALFEPRIDPGALVKAVAQGSDVGAAIADLDAPTPLHRFPVVLRAANEACADVRALGAALLSVLEKADAEELSRLRQTHEISVLDATTVIRSNHVDEAKATLESLQRSRELAQVKLDYYGSRPFMNPGEIAALIQSGLSASAALGLPIGHTLASTMRLLPEVSMGWAGYGGSPQLSASSGGGTLAAITSDATQVIADTEHILDKGAAMASTLAAYDRRMDDWKNQHDLAAKEAQQLDSSIEAARLRVTAAQEELDVHKLQLANARAVDEFMRTKYTAEELYQWHIGQISGVYFQTYKLAYDLARQAERCYRFELGIADSSYIRFGYWDSLQKGLLSGEMLQHDLRRLEAAYRDQDRREFELTKHVSLRLLDPEALITLRQTGRCFFSLPEEIFDLDYPGHYLRRIKSVSLTLPCVAGPYTTISCTLRLLRNSIRVSTGRPKSYARNGDDDRFVENNIAVKAIASSGGQNDSGVFELSFRDERYLPFEGAGAISGWALELFNDANSDDFGKPLRQFDYETIADAVLHVKYTAREDAGTFKDGAIKHLRDRFKTADPTPAAIMLDWRRDFPGQWNRFLNPTKPADGNVFALDVAPNLFPVRDQGKKLVIEKVQLLARCTKDGEYKVTLEAPADAATLTSKQAYGGLHEGQMTVPKNVDLSQDPATWKFRMKDPTDADLSAGEVTDVVMLVSYSWTP